MIELERHIEILLLNNDCVIVPNFGGFMTHHVEAHYDEEQEMYYPPLRTIGFNPQLTLNDSLLAQSYVDVYDISYPEALQRIDSEVSEVKQHLANEGSYEMSDLGTIFYHHDGSYTFQPCEAGILTPELYGLSTVDITPLRRVQVRTTAPAPQLEASTNPKNVSIETHPVLSAETEEEAQTDTEVAEVRPSRTIEIKVSVLRNLAAACLAVLAFFLFPATLHDAGNTADMFGKINTRLLYRIMPKDVTTGNAHTEAQPAKQKAEEVEKAEQPQAAASTTAKQTAAEEKAEPFYTIVLASRVTIRNATTYVEELQKQGVKEAEVYTKAKTTRVIFGHYATEQAAYQALNSLRHKPAFTEGWVMKIKHPTATR